MTTKRYKTNINCGSCLKSVTPFINEVDNVDLWKVDLEDPDRILEVELEDDDSSAFEKAVKKAGYNLELID